MTNQEHPEWKDVGIRWGRLRLAQTDQVEQGWAVHEHSEDFSRCWVIGWFEHTKEGYNFQSVGMRPWDTDQPAMYFIEYCAKMLNLYFEMTDDG